MDERPRRILIMDDEPENTEALEACLRKSKIRYHTASSLEDAAERVRGHVLRPYGLIISDNHYCDDSGIYPTGTVHGIDFATILRGERKQWGDEHRAFAEEHFGTKLPLVRSAYASVPIVAFSGSAVSDRECRPDLYRGIEVVEKRPDFVTGTPCELELVDIMADLGFPLKRFNFTKYKQREGLTAGVRQ